MQILRGKAEAGELVHGTAVGNCLVFRTDYIDYAMRGLGSLSCGPDPEECYELRAHEFRLAFMLCPCADEAQLLSLSRKRYASVTEKLSDTHRYSVVNISENEVECDRD